jgi:hypothetical protein
MNIVMRIVQQFDACDEKQFMELERRFAALETRRPGLPQGRRLQPIAAVDPCNTLIWEGEFLSLDKAYQALTEFEGNAEHERLAKKQHPLFKNVRIEFYRVVERNADLDTR